MSSLIVRGGIVEDLSMSTKEEVICYLVNKLTETEKISCKSLFYRDVLEREKLASTYIGYHIGFAHGKSQYAKEAAICIGRLKEPVVWDEETGETVKVVILAAVPETEQVYTHMKILANLSRSIMHEEIRKQLLSSSEEELYSLMNQILGA